ncbi:autotransporter assembly complex protein TamA [Shewanella sp. AS16]|uniref:autotransporter assembly complex protein TamA n=1 Tax=Shewanella sp. AS16 TaxID=2907625 RepID=UPI001F38BC45|nr:autotransporter assembly complex family protein [Shewanella sp. AS16]MCE9684713.1 autotransporter assembly complex protein TamA [Shewanella sp. AS16]
MLVSWVLSCRYAHADAAWLSLKIEGVEGKLAQNVHAHLGPLPDSAVQRRAYLFNVESNVTAALESLGYYHGRLEKEVVETDSGPWPLTLKITPGEPTRLQWVDIQFAGEMLDDDAFDAWLDLIALKPGDILDHGQYTDIKSQLLGLAFSRGYFDGKLTLAQIKVNRDLDLARINLHYDSGQRYHLGEISFEGHTLEPGFLERLIPFEPHAAYSNKRLNALNGKLLDTGYFANIKVLPQIDKLAQGQVPVRVELTPRADHAIELGLGADIGKSADSVIEPRVRVTWRTPQLNRYGHSQETSLEWKPDKPKFLTTYTLPLSHPLDDQLKIRLGLLRDQYGVTQDYDAAGRTFNDIGRLESSKYLLGLLRQHRLADNWLFGYSLEANREFYTQADVDYDPVFYLAGVSLSQTVRSDNALDPKSGFRQIYSLEYGDPELGSQTRLARLQARFKWIDTFFDKHRIVSRLDLGANLAEEHQLAYISPSLRYFAGGDQSVRGYSYQELGPYRDYINSQGGLSREVVGGRYLMVASLEYQYYLTQHWRLGSFIDAGNAFDNRQFEPVVSVGGGVHWISPIGPIRLDLGVGLKETDTVDRSWRIHLTMGTDL